MMGDTGRKLTIRMPDNPRLRTAEVGGIHVDPGTRAVAGTPVMTLVHRRREHVVRAPRSGRIVPLVANGDWVSGGEPLYVLKLDEAALEEANRASRIQVEADRQREAVSAEADREPVQVARRTSLRKEPDEPVDFLKQWGMPIVAIALYVVACFALLPVLSALGENAGPAMTVGLVGGCIAFAGLIYNLYAPSGGRWPRRTVGTVAASWLVMSGLAIFWMPSGPPDDPAVATDGVVIADLEPGPDGTETGGLAATAVAPAPVTERPGVIVIAPKEIPAPPHAEPRFALAGDASDVVPHGVAVRRGADMELTRRSGDALAAISQQPTASMGKNLNPPIARLALFPGQGARSEGAESDSTTADHGFSEIEAVPAPQPPVAGVASADLVQPPIPLTPVADTVAPDRVLAARAVGLLLSRTRLRDGGAPELPESGPIMAGAGVPVIRSEGGGPSIVSGPPPRLAAGRLAPVVRAFALADLREAPSPALVLLTAYRASESLWQTRQAERLDAQGFDLSLQAAFSPVAFDAVIALTRLPPATEPAFGQPDRPEGVRAALVHGGMRPAETRSDIVRVSSMSDREARGTMPQHLAGPAGGSRPDPVFFVALRSGSDAWMLDQEDRLI
ncbi:MAG: hypothetical protein AAF334_04925, partial [Pseudomonadota bacterium]